MLDRRSWEAQIGELIRLVASLPEALKHNNFQALHDEMLQDYRARAPYARYLVRLRQDLLVAQDQIVGQRERLQRSNQLYFQYHKTVQINSFVEKRENEIVAYVGARGAHMARGGNDARSRSGRRGAAFGARETGLCSTSTRSSCWTKKQPW